MFVHHGEHGARRYRRRAPAGDIYADMARTDEIIAAVERRLGITEMQRAPWEALAETARDCGEAIQIARNMVREAPAEPFAGFDGAALMVQVMAAALRRLRPRFEDLYQALDERQRQALCEIMASGPLRPFRADA